jgi:glutamate/aspartate transport system substrate-binding protein
MIRQSLRMLRSLLLVTGLVCQLAYAQDVEPAKLTSEQIALGPTLSRIAETGEIYLAHREAAVPFSFVLADRVTPAGYTWDICQHVAKAVEQKLGKSIRIVPVVASAYGRMMQVKVGMADVECGSTTNTVGRQRQVAFSNTIFASEIRTLVRADSGIKTIEDLNGKRIVTTAATNAERMVRQFTIQRGMAVKQISERTNFSSFARLERGEADAFVNDDAILLGQRASSKTPENFVLMESTGMSVEPYGLVLRNDDPVFKAMVDQVLVQLMQSGEIEQIYNKWFTQPIPPNNQTLGLPLSDLNKAVFANPNDRPAN